MMKKIHIGNHQLKNNKITIKEQSQSQLNINQVINKMEILEKEMAHIKTDLTTNKIDWND